LLLQREKVGLMEEKFWKGSREFERRGSGWRQDIKISEKLGEIKRLGYDKIICLTLSDEGEECRVSSKLC
jgi:hypothetical protein